MPGSSAIIHWLLRASPPGYTWSLGLLYLVFAVCVIRAVLPPAGGLSAWASGDRPWLSYF